ncbi:hypothetical protein NQ314_005821 [Rhamnusium bicolor]|uniref:1-acylglycerol-3-phosphate O-acyltransferase n=1 Tax=Rhamnusium bicolor TaxID=1586634 RepID=A0AAV8ZED8_9CUCU|nr:hypothetical protein NQ314_005821 [Rhamnusium bicolor]
MTENYIPLKKGAFHMAISGQLPIIPVVYSRYYFLDKDVKRFDHGKVLITALPQIDTKGMTMQDIEALMEKVRGIMSTTYHETTKEVLEGLNPVSSQKIN